MEFLQDDDNTRRLKVELADLEREWVQVEGKLMKPSQCYRLELHPRHVLYNTNCPDVLRDRIEAILRKYTP